MKIKTKNNYCVKRIILFIFILYAIIPNNYAQKKIKAKGDYTHPITNFVFPVQLYDFERIGIYSFDTKRENIGIVYENSKTTISLYIYPAGDGYEDRLRSEFIKSLQEIANLTKIGIDINQQPIQYEGDYICNGFNAIIKDRYKYNSLTLYECGRWFFKIRITSDGLDSAYLSDFEQKIIRKYEPSKLTALNPFKSRASVHIAPGTLNDTILFGSVAGFTFKKLEWALDSVSEKERASGFPSIHIGMHIAALKAFLDYRIEKRPNTATTEEIRKMIDEIQEISDNGFLEAYIFDQYDMLLRVDDYVITEEVWEKYIKWKDNRTFLFSLTHIVYSVVGYVE